MLQTPVSSIFTCRGAESSRVFPDRTSSVFKRRFSRLKLNLETSLQAV